MAEYSAAGWDRSKHLRDDRGNRWGLRPLSKCDHPLATHWRDLGRRSTTGLGRQHAGYLERQRGIVTNPGFRMLKKNKDAGML